MGMRSGSLLGVAMALALFGGALAGEGGAAAPEPPRAGPAVPVEEPSLPGTGPLTRLGRGASNILLSPLEIPATMMRVGGERNAFFGMWAGGLEGMGNGLVRLSAGVLETLTAPLPSDGLPLYNKRLGQRALPPLRPPSGITRP